MGVESNRKICNKIIFATAETEGANNYWDSYLHLKWIDYNFELLNVCVM